MILLDELNELHKEIQETEMEIKELTILSGMSMNGMPSGGTVASPVEKYFDRIEKLRNKLEYKKEQLSTLIKSIKNVEVRIIAELRFIKNRSFQEIGDEMFMERTTAYKKLKNYRRKDECNESIYNRQRCVGS